MKIRHWTRQPKSDTPDLFSAAMHAAIGGATQISRSGEQVIFAQPACGRRDLSGIAEVAAAQLHQAGIDPAATTPEQIDAWRAWRETTDRARAIGGARVRVSGIQHRAVGAHTLIPCQAVELIDGWGLCLADALVDCEEQYEPETRNKIGGLGAFRAIPNIDGIAQAIEALRAEFPDYADAPVTGAAF